MCQKIEKYNKIKRTTSNFASVSLDVFVLLFHSFVARQEEKDGGFFWQPLARSGSSSLSLYFGSCASSGETRRGGEKNGGLVRSASGHLHQSRSFGRENERGNLPTFQWDLCLLEPSKLFLCSLGNSR